LDLMIVVTMLRLNGLFELDLKVVVIIFSSLNSSLRQ